MKHVREALPDVQRSRPGVSAGLASVLDRATDKDLDRRYPDAPTMVADLEDALAIEASRSGQATGEATAVIRTLPPHARRRLPLRLRWHIPLLALVLVGALVAAAFAFLLKEGVDRTQRGAGATRDPAPANTRVVSVPSDGARDYDPLGDGDKTEHREEARLVNDRDPSTAWRTETYRSFDKGGVGIYVDARPAVRATALEIVTPKAGWTVELYGARSGPPEDFPRAGLGRDRRRRGDQAQAALPPRVPALVPLLPGLDHGPRRRRPRRDRRDPALPAQGRALGVRHRRLGGWPTPPRPARSRRRSPPARSGSRKP
jgi:serine/threonine-protein kinase